MTENQHLSISFIGDISFNDAYIEYYQSGINPFKNIQPILQSKDYVIGNLECMAKGEMGENLLKKPRLTSTVETLNYLNMLNVNVVSLAQNHIYDHLEDGFIKTTSFLDENNIQYLGASLNKADVTKPVIISKRGISIGLLNYVTQDTNPNIPSDAKVYLNILNVEKVIIDIKDLKEKTDHVVLLLHWGGRVEGGGFPDIDQPKLAKKFIDAGADLIIGHHSHTIQPVEVYKGKYIFYSLGNFCFDDVLSDGKLFPLSEARKKGLMAEISFKEKDYNVKLHYFKNKKFSYELYFPGLAACFIKKIVFKILFLNKFFWKIYYAENKLIRPLSEFLSRKDISLVRKIKRIFGSMVKKLEKEIYEKNIRVKRL